MAGNGYYKIGLRYYDDSLGRWTQTDPAERAINPMQPAEAQPYNYSGCNPVNQTDPTGACSDVWTFVGGFATLAGAKFSVLGFLAGKPALAAGGVALSGAGAFGIVGIGLTVVGVAALLACAGED